MVSGQAAGHRILWLRSQKCPSPFLQLFFFFEGVGEFPTAIVYNKLFISRDILVDPYSKQVYLGNDASQLLWITELRRFIESRLYGPPSPMVTGYKRDFLWRHCEILDIFYSFV